MKHEAVGIQMLDDRLPDNDPGLERILFSAPAIHERIAELAAAIVRDIADLDEVMLLGVLKGACVFMSDLGRAIRRAGGPPLHYEFIRASTYGNTIKQSVDASRRTRLDGLPANLSGRDVILVEDILDQGFTLTRLCRDLVDTGAVRSLRLCVLLEKHLDTPSSQVAAVRRQLKPDYVGFTVPDRWVAGYGLDVNEHYRDLPYIAVVRESHFTPGSAAEEGE